MTDVRQFTAILVVFAVLMAGCTPIIPGSNSTGNISGTNQSEKIYPAAIGFDIQYCEGLGYNYEYRLDETGKYRGYCKLTKDIECPSEDFADGLCHREHTLCEIKGYTLKIGVQVMGNTTLTYPICIFPDNSYCRENDFFNRKCSVKW